MIVRDLTHNRATYKTMRQAAPPRCDRDGRRARGAVPGAVRHVRLGVARLALRGTVKAQTLAEYRRLYDTYITPESARGRSARFLRPKRAGSTPGKKIDHATTLAAASTLCCSHKSCNRSDQRGASRSTGARLLRAEVYQWAERLK